MLKMPSIARNRLMASASTQSLVSVCGGALLLMVAALWNGYPLVFPDTGVYITQALELRGEGSRPPYYSIFILPFHFGITLWPVVVVQCILTSILLYFTSRAAIGRSVRTGQFLLLVAVLTVFSSLPWLTGQLIPDLFSGLLIICIYLICFGWDRLSLGERVFVTILLLLSVSFHYSHFPLLALVGGAAMFVALIQARPWRDILRIGALSGAILVLVAGAFIAYSAAYTGRVMFSPDGSRFLLARMLDDGTAKAYLRESCLTATYVLCEYLDDIRGNHNTFLWNESSPWRVLEARLGYLGARDEAAAIVRGTLRSHAWSQAGISVVNAFRQLGTFGTADTLCPCVGDSYVSKVIATRFPAENFRYLESAQSRDALPVEVLRATHGVAIIFSLLLLAALVIGLRRCARVTVRTAADFEALAAVVLVGVIANAGLAGVLSGVADRYQSRVVWLIVLVACVGVMQVVRGVHGRHGNARAAEEARQL